MSQTASPRLRVTLLGTGGPELSIDRMGAATLVEAGDQTLLFDAGRGVMQRLFESGVRLNDVTKVIFTHLHSDHIEGLPQLWITPWFLLGRETPMRFWGPVGTRAMLDGMRKFLGHDVVHRVSHDAPAEALEIEATEFTGQGMIYDAGGVSVEAVPVEHHDGNPAFGFIVRHAGATLVLSGDCTYSAELTAAGKDADLVVHNVFAPSPDLLAVDAHKARVACKLASPEEAAAVFVGTGTRCAAYTHIIRIDSSLDDIVQRTRAAGYSGMLVMGEDRMAIEVGDEDIRVVPPPSLDEVIDVTKRGDG